MALKSSEARDEKRNKTKSLIISKSRGHAGVNISLRWKSNFEEISFEIFTERGKTFTRFQIGGSSFQMMGAATDKASIHETIGCHLCHAVRTACKPELSRGVRSLLNLGDFGI